LSTNPVYWHNGGVIILEVLKRVIEQKLPHLPLIIVFTVQEEAGLCGANGFDGSTWHVTDGIVFDNAFEAGVVISQGAAYEAFDIKISGRTGHPSKDLSHTVNVKVVSRYRRTHEFLCSCPVSAVVIACTDCHAGCFYITQLK
jgi:putative aminopeptidase FrvX